MQLEPVAPGRTINRPLGAVVGCASIALIIQALMQKPFLFFRSSLIPYSTDPGRRGYTFPFDSEPVIVRYTRKIGPYAIFIFGLYGYAPIHP